MAQYLKIDSNTKYDEPQNFTYKWPAVSGKTYKLESVINTPNPPTVKGEKDDAQPNKTDSDADHAVPEYKKLLKVVR